MRGRCYVLCAMCYLGSSCALGTSTARDWGLRLTETAGRVYPFVFFVFVDHETKLRSWYMVLAPQPARGCSTSWASALHIATLAEAVPVLHLGDKEWLPP